MPLVLQDQLVIREALDRQVLQVTQVSLVQRVRQGRQVLLARLQQCQVLREQLVLPALQDQQEIQV